MDKLHGKELSTDIYKLSTDGKTLDIATQGTKPNGDAFHDSTEYTRVSGTKGFFGKWKSVKVNSTFSGYVIKDNVDGSLSWQIPEFKATLQIRPDGKDVVPSGPTVPPGFTLALTQVGPRTFKLVEKMKGKPILEATDTISADGKTFTEQGSSVGVTEPYTSVYDKQ